MTRQDVAIVGVAESAFGTVPDKTVHELHAQAAVRANQDAGVSHPVILSEAKNLTDPVSQTLRVAGLDDA